MVIRQLMMMKQSDANFQSDVKFYWLGTAIKKSRVFSFIVIIFSYLFNRFTTKDCKLTFLVKISNIENIISLKLKLMMTNHHLHDVCKYLLQQKAIKSLFHHKRIDDFRFPISFYLVVVFNGMQ